MTVYAANQKTHIKMTKQLRLILNSNENSALKHFIPLLHQDVPRPLTDSPDHFLHSTSPVSATKSSDTYMAALCHSINPIQHTRLTRNNITLWIKGFIF